MARSVKEVALEKFEELNEKMSILTDMANAKDTEGLVREIYGNIEELEEIVNDIEEVE